MEASLFPHLNDTASALLHSTDEERIYAIREGTWLAYPTAKRILGLMEELLSYPTITRMPNLLLIAPSFNGKTSILERFMSLHPPDEDPTKEVTLFPVVRVEMPPSPDTNDFYTRILEQLNAPFKHTSPEREKYSQIKTLFKKMSVKMLIIDEIHHLLSGGKVRQSQFRNALKSLGNETRVVIVAAGIDEAYNAFIADPQMSSRFPPVVLPSWKAGKEFASLLMTMENRIPLKNPSGLKAPELMLTIHSRSEGTIGDMCDLVKELAVDAIRTKAEKITLEQAKKFVWVPPSKRREYRKF